MKKKATSSSSERSSFQSLKEAKDFVDSSFEELLKQLDEYFNAGRPRLRVVSAQELESRRLDPDPIGTRIAFLNKGIDQLHKLQQAVLQSCSKICILDAFDESKEFFELISDQLDKRILYLQAEIDQFLVKQKNGSGDPPSIIPPAIWLPSEIKQRAERERKKIIRGLPGLLAYQNSLEQSKPKKSRNPEAIRKEKDYLYLLDQYESWKAKTAQETGRKKLNPKDWYKNFATWTPTSKRLFDEYAKSGSGDDNSDIVSIIKYAQKIKRERSKGGE